MVRAEPGSARTGRPAPRRISSISFALPVTSAAERSRRSLPSLGLFLLLLLLDLLLFAPSFVFSQPHAAFWPSLPDPLPSGLRGVWQTLLHVVLRRPNLDVFRWSFDFGLMLAILLLTVHNRHRTTIRNLLVAGYVWLWLFLAYHHAVSYFFNRKPALGEDWRLALNLVHFFSDVMSFKVVLGIAGFFATLVALGVLSRLAFARLQRRSEPWNLRSRQLLSAALVLPALGSFAWFGIQRDDPLLQLTSKRMFYNWQASSAAAAYMHELRSGHIDRRNHVFSKLKLQRKPNFYLLMIEAYGEILATWDMTPAYQALLQRVEERLGRAGYFAASAYTESPVHGGTSWLAIATVHTGILVNQPRAYYAMEIAGFSLPTLTNFFEGQGYRSYTVQPGTMGRKGMGRLDVYNHDVVLDGMNMGYRGRKYGWGKIPDQYSLGTLREKYFTHAPEPHYLFYMAVSTHYPWDDIPNYADDWHKLDDPRYVPSSAPDPNWPPFPETASIGSAFRRGYFQSVEYEWRLLSEFLEAESSQDIVIAILGDHQPRLESNVPGEVTMNTPLHMLSRDSAFIASLAGAGFQSGLRVPPGKREPLQMQGLYSLWISKLAAAYGAEGSRSAPYYPDGIGLSGLNP